MQKRKKITLEEIVRKLKPKSYDELYDRVTQLVDEGKLQPIAKQGNNGMKKPLPNCYFEVIFEINEEEVKDRIFNLSKIDNTYYNSHLDKFLEEEEYVTQLNNFLRDHSDLLDVVVSENERSFQIWGKEKFLHGNDKDKGVKGKQFLLIVEKL